MNNSAFMDAKWIWLNEKDYPEFQHSKQTNEADSAGMHYCVAEFKQSFKLRDKPVFSALHIFADTKYRISINQSVLGVGPVNNGGDFVLKESLPLCYYSTFEFNAKKGNNEIFVEVQLSPTVLTETSQGKGGLIALCRFDFANGETQYLCTDESWLARRNTSWETEKRINFQNPQDEWKNAKEIKSIWQLKPSPILNLQEKFLDYSEIIVFDEYKHRIIEKNGNIYIKNGSPVTFFLDFNKIFAGYTYFEFKGSKVSIQTGIQEILGKTHETERVETDGGCSFRGIRLQSIGCLTVTVTFNDDNDCAFEKFGIISTHYPVNMQGEFKCSDKELEAIFDLGKHTEIICRQSLHLDSPLHQEHLACTGDYYIESLIDAVVLGDTSLSRFDIIRTCDLLRKTKGIMFHTTYSLILVQMITDYYKYSGDKSIFYDTIDALHILMKQFTKYADRDSLLHYPPNYMFVDWLYVDSFSLHHPPKTLGQGVLNAFYYKALTDMVFICTLLGGEKADYYKQQARQVKEAFNNTFWSNERGLYYEGLSTPEKENGYWRPENPNKLYFGQHTNTLAVLYDLADNKTAVKIMEKVIEDKTLSQAQPYFMHYVLEAIYKTSLFSKYGLSQIKRWARLVNECDKGLKEVFTGFDCDYSHAWGATPTFQLPTKLLGLEIIEAGFKKITLKPNLFGLSFADISITTPFGLIKAQLDNTGKTNFEIPPQIEYEIL